MRLLLAALFLETGFVLLVVPWSPYWDRNFFASSLPALQGLLMSNYVRGAVSGLGVVNVLAAAGELIDLFLTRPPEPSAPPPPVEPHP